MVCVFSLIALAIIVYIFYKKLSNCDAKAVYGTYNKDKGSWFYPKFCFIYLLLRFRKWKQTRIAKSTELNAVVKTCEAIEDMEKVQRLSSHPKALDAVFFNGASQAGHYFVTAFVRRPESAVDGFVFLRIPGLGLYQSPRLPDTRLVADKNDAYSGEGISIEPLRSMREWSVRYKGKMRKSDDPDVLVNVKLTLNFTSQLRHFDFNVDTSPIAMARAIAREPWSTAFFQRLEDLQQHNYEQMGVLEGVAEIEGVGEIPLRLHSMRDHSYGVKRESKDIHRYIIHSVTVEDGTRFMIGVISMSLSISVFECGYLYTPSGKLIPIDRCDMPLWYLGENGSAPRDYGFTFEAGGKKYEVAVKIEELPELFIGEQWEARILEGMCEFTVNRKRGWGFAEWDYNYKGGRDMDYALDNSTDL